ncbi:alpha/beta hydrolase [Jiangella aurantiaca]|uniref:Alpha/beta hydrolase n=1 Tax=Jiangella aurantiaca TaxID=2530373 RepID=A0A4R5ABS7_9ACTN|nr:alpha/beta hydrolase [Jiangella aurantiaca]TDD69833.1 alpha/beta hydrolase [Jiangella aurantiaca]
MAHTLTTLRYGIDADENQAVDLLTPERMTSSVAVFMVHGGSWYHGSRQMYHPHLGRFADAGHLGASVGYRLDPRSRLHDKMRDVARGYQAFREYVREHHPSVSATVLVGGSAGAHLASLLALRGPHAWNPDTEPFGDAAPRACICWYGPGTLQRWPDMDPRIRAAMEQLCGAAYDDPGSASVFTAASPGTYASPAPPECLFLLAEHEDLFPHEYVHDLADRLRSAGASAEIVVVPGTKHGFMMDVDSAPATFGFQRMYDVIARYDR